MRGRQLSLSNFCLILVKFFFCLFDKPALTHVSLQGINIGPAAPVASKSYRFDKVKQVIIDYHIKNMLDDDIIMRIESPYAPLWYYIERIMKEFG